MSNSNYLGFLYKLRQMRCWHNQHIKDFFGFTEDGLNEAIRQIENQEIAENESQELQEINDAIRAVEVYSSYAEEDEKEKIKMKVAELQKTRLTILKEDRKRYPDAPTLGRGLKMLEDHFKRRGRRS